MPKIIVHISTGGNWNTTEWFFDNLTAQGVPFDIIGLSYYPFWDGTLANLSNCLNNAANRYHKPVSVMETAFPWNNSYWTTNINGIVPSVTGQVQYVVALAPIVNGVSGGFGAGVFWWGRNTKAPMVLTKPVSNTASFFDAGWKCPSRRRRVRTIECPSQPEYSVKQPEYAAELAAERSWTVSGDDNQSKRTCDLVARNQCRPKTPARCTGRRCPLDSSPQRFLSSAIKLVVRNAVGGAWSEAGSCPAGY
jgi:hypothetical protein